MNYQHVNSLQFLTRDIGKSIELNKSYKIILLQRIQYPKMQKFAQTKLFVGLYKHIYFSIICYIN